MNVFYRVTPFKQAQTSLFFNPINIFDTFTTLYLHYYTFLIILFFQLHQLLSLISTFPLRNYHAAKDATVDLLMTLVQKCSGWLKFQNECGIVVRNAIGNLLQPHHGKSLQTAVSMLLRLAPTLAGANLSSVASSVVSQHKAKERHANGALQFRFLLLFSLSNLFHCLFHGLLYLKHPNKSFLTQ